MNLGLDGHVSVHEHCSSYNYAWVSDFKEKKKVCELNFKRRKMFYTQECLKVAKKKARMKKKKEKSITLLMQMAVYF